MGEITNKLLYVQQSKCRLSETKIVVATIIYLERKIITYAGVIDFNDIAPTIELKLCEVKEGEISWEK